MFVVCSGVGSAIVEKTKRERERIADREMYMVWRVRVSVLRSDVSEDTAGNGIKDETLEQLC